MMKNARFVLAAAALLLAVVTASAQQTPNHSVPIGRGGGVQGFGAAIPGVAGQPLVSQGATADPGFGTIANSGFTAGAADTYKGSLNGTTVVDVAAPPCTAVNQAWRYAAGVGPNCGTVSVTTGFDMPVNLGLSASAAGGALTINLTQANGSAPTSTNPVLVPFRSTTAATGTVTWNTVSAATSLTIPSGASLGTSSSNVPFRVWIFAAYNGGSTELAVATCSNSGAIFGCASWEHTLKTSTTLNASSTAAGTLYAPNAATLDAVRIIGFCDFASGLVTAGSWASSCTTLQIFGPGIKKPGEVVQTVAPQFGSVTAVTNASTTVVATTNITASITPTSTPNLVRYSASTTVSNSSGTNGSSIQMYRGSTAIGLLSKATSSGNNTAYGQVLTGLDSPGSVSSTVYALKLLAIAGGTASAPSVNTDSATEVLEEIMG